MTKEENVQALKSEKEIQEFRKALSMSSTHNRDLLIFNMGINTGIQVRELLKLKVKDVRGKITLTIVEDRSGRTIKFPLNMLAGEILEYTEGMEEEEFLFSSTRRNKPITRIQVYRVLQRAANFLGREDIGTQTLRKTFGYHYYRKTRDIRTLMYIFNHKTSNQTKEYIGINGKENDYIFTLKDFYI